MAKVVARVSGVAIRPGISRNRRLYTREAIARMVARGQDRIESGPGITLVKPAEEQAPPQPLTQKTHHAAEDDSTRIVGRVTSLTLDDQGAARFTADIADTEHGRTIASLLDTSDGQPPFLRGVSIRGAWAGQVRQIPGSDGEPLTTSDDLSLNGLDYTGTPGVEGAQVDGFEWATASYPHPGETADGRAMIYESVTEALVTAITEETPAAEVTPPATETIPPGPAGISEALAGEVRDVLRSLVPWEASPSLSKRNSGLSGAGRVWADPGYQADKKQRYDISSKANAKAAWSYVNQADNAKLYTSAQLKRVKGRIIKALKAFGVTVAAEGWTIEPAYRLTETVTEFMGRDPSMAGSWAITACNGPICLNLSSYCMDPADLDVILRAAADAACKALAALDPDMDGDVDVDGVGGNSDTDGDAGETAPAPALPGPIPLRQLAAETAAPPAPAVEAEDPDDEPAGESTAAQDPATAPAAATEETEEPVMSEPTPQETAAGQAPAATATIPVTASVTMDRATLESMLADAVAAGRKQGKKERRAAELAAAVAAATPPAAPAPAETAPAAPVTPAAAPAAPVAETGEDIARQVSEAVAAKLAAEGFAPAPAAPVQETRDQMIERLVAEQYTKAKQDLVASGRVVVQRTGLNVDGAVDEHRAAPAVPGTAVAQGVHPETGFPTSFPGGGSKLPHQWTSEELTQFGGAVLDNYVMGSRAVLDLP